MIQQIVPTEERGQRVEYIERLALELARMATGLNLPVLAYLLDMAAEEAALARGPSVASAPLPADELRLPRRRDGAPT